MLAAEPGILLEGYCGEYHDEDGSDEEHHFNAPNVKFVLYRDGTMVVSGSGNMESYLNYEDCCTKYRIRDQMPWYNHRDKIKKLIIEDGITKIGWNNFWGCVNLESIRWPDTLRSVYSSAFEGCTSLEEVTLPACVNEWFDFVFAGCTGLKKVTLEPGVQFGEPEGYHYGSNMFRDCTMLETVVLPENMKVIPERFLLGCPNIREFRIPEGVVAFGSYPAFMCPEKVTLPGSVKYLTYGAFEGCTTLEELQLPEGLESIEEAFVGCKNLKSLEIPATVKDFGYGTFMKSGIEEITLPDGMEKIQEKMFFQCRKLKNIRIPDSVRYIDENAFFGCTNLRRVVLPGNLMKICGYAFAYCENLIQVQWNPAQESGYRFFSFSFLGCTKLKEFTIPENTVEIGNMFVGCKRITVKVRCTSDTFQESPFFEGFPQSAAVIVPKGKIREFKNVFLKYETDTYKIRVREGDV